MTQQLYRNEFLQQSIHSNQDMDELVHHISKDNTAEENRAAPGQALGDCTVAAQQRRKNHW
jgi:hypothetical protein